MRKLTLLIVICCFYMSAAAQTMQEKLYYTCKVWGFVKYYHSEVSVCNVNWDSVLIDVLPDVRAASNSIEFNDALMHMINAAGPMAIATTPFPDVIPPELKRNRDWAWISSPVLRPDVKIALDTIKNNFRPHQICWYGENNTPYTGLASNWGGYMMFPHDTVILPVNTYTTFPGQDERLQQLFEFWNIIRYFNPSNYVLDVPWDTTLMQFAAPIANVTSAEGLYHLYLKIAKQLDDAHVYGLTWSYYYDMLPGYYKPQLLLGYYDGKYVVTKSAVAGISIGDAIMSVDGKTPAQWEDSLRPYYSCGNESVFHRIMCDNILRREVNSITESLVVADSMGISHTFSAVAVNPYTYSSFFYGNYHYPADTLDDVKWDVLQCDIGYINMGNIENADVTSMYSALQSKEAIIIDLRNYPNGTAWNMAGTMTSAVAPFSKLSFPDTTYPGVYYYQTIYMSPYSWTTPYSGKIIILINENTQSQAEYSTMIFEALPNDVTKVGSQTAGADGDVTWMKLSDDMRFGWSSLGVFYPNGDSTQRIGIVPDSVIRPTALGIRRHRDEVLEKALKIAGCDIFPHLAVSDIHSPVLTAAVYPNPANETVNIRMAQATDASITITDVAGKVMVEQQLKGTAQTTINISMLSPGMYFVNVRHEGQQYVTKLVKE